MIGVSYPGWTTAMAMLDPHPALKAVCPQASPADMFIGDDFHHNGAFRLSYGFEYAFLTENARRARSSRSTTTTRTSGTSRSGPLSNVRAKYLKDKKLPTWDDFRLHPNYDAFWQRQAMRPYLKRVTVPTLNVAGWWDQEDFYGPVTIYRELEKHDSLSRNFLVVGPWKHGGWSGGTGQKLGNIDFGSPTGEYFRAKIEVPFFAYYLKDKGKLDAARGDRLRVREQHVAHVHRWPPKEAKTRALYFHAGGMLSFDPPTRRRRERFDAT